jgi:hypothetical protein
MNNFLFENDFLLHAVDWPNVLESSGKCFLKLGPYAEGMGYVRVGYDIIEHVMYNPPMLLERDTFIRHVDKLKNEMILPERVIEVPYGFNPDFDRDGNPISALQRVRNRLAMRSRIERMHALTLGEIEDPLYLCMTKQKTALREVMAKINGFQDFFASNPPNETVEIDFRNIGLSLKTRIAVKRIDWGPVNFLGGQCGFTIVFSPFCESTRKFAI